MQKILALFSLSLLVLVNACTPSSPTTDDGLSSSAADSSMMDDSDSSAMDDDSSSEDSSMMQESSSEKTSVPSSSKKSETRVINMTVENWEFTPNMIKVKKGEHVMIHLTDAAGVHSFMSGDLGLNVAIQPGETKDIEIPTDTIGTFSFRCGVPCGPGHKDMTGTIVVE